MREQCFVLASQLISIEHKDKKFLKKVISKKYHGNSSLSFPLMAATNKIAEELLAALGEPCMEKTLILLLVETEFVSKTAADRTNTKFINPKWSDKRIED